MSTPTPVQRAAELAGQAAEAIRSLNHLTLPANGAPGLVYPADVDSVVADIQVAVQRLPQLLWQLRVWLEDQYDAGRVGHDRGGDVHTCLAILRADIEGAIGAAHEMEYCLNRAHSQTAHFTGVEAR